MVKKTQVRKTCWNKIIQTMFIGGDSNTSWFVRVPRRPENQAGQTLVPQSFETSKTFGVALQIIIATLQLFQTVNSLFLENLGLILYNSVIKYYPHADFHIL